MYPRIALPAPSATGTLIFASAQIESALAVTFAMIPFPETVVIAKRLIAGLWAAKIMASASS